MAIYANLVLHSGESGLVAKMYSLTTGNMVNSPGTALTELSNGVFFGSVSYDTDLDYRVDIIDTDGDTIASDFLYSGSSVVGMSRQEPEAFASGQYYNIVTRDSGDKTAVHFEWPAAGRTITGRRSIHGAAYTPISGTISEVRSEGVATLYSISYNAEDRASSGAVVFELTDGIVTRYLPVYMSGKSGIGLSSAPLTISIQETEHRIELS